MVRMLKSLDSEMLMNTDKAVIAVIDDEESVCKALERLLRSAGLRANTFLNGADFLSFIETNRPDCVVLDLNMMPMNGLEVLKSLAMKRLGLPVIIITGDDNEEKYRQVIDQGAAAYLLKPIDDQLLLDTIDTVLTH